jgi:acetylornithine deacetylase/succinyl-diaminopimelate desuccinylase-like protein
MDPARTQNYVDRTWNESVMPALQEYIRIPNKSPAFDPAWQANMDAAVRLVEAWCRERAVPGLRIEVVRLEGRTPLIFMELPGTSEDTVLLYGHLDKQPEFSGWEPGLGPWTPVVRGDRLYGRGGADDGYAAFACLAALGALADQKLEHARCVVLIEACEESGSLDLPFYIQALEKRIGRVSLVVCLDSGCANYDQLWMTTSLRGMVGGDLVVEVLEQGVHSGDASGIVPSSFRILRQLLSRLEDETSGAIREPGLYVDIPPERLSQARDVARILGKDLVTSFPWRGSTRAMAEDPVELVLNRTWRPVLSITGARGLPDLQDSGNVLRPMTAVKISLRLPPTADAGRAWDRLVKLFESDPPYGAVVRFENRKASAGWNAPATAPWLEASIRAASRTFFGHDPAFMGEGGSIPFMEMLGRKYPEAQFVVTGVLGPQSNAHGPNEFLHIPTAKRVTACVARILHDHAGRARTT